MKHSKSSRAVFLSCENTAREGTPKETTFQLLNCDPHMGGFIEITITYPHTTNYLSMTSDKQKQLLSKIFNRIKGVIPVTHQAVVKYVFEYTKSGQIHLHGYVAIHDSLKLYPIGAVSDMAKVLLSLFPKKYSKFSTDSINGDWCRFRSTQGVIQYRYSHQIDRINSWKQYIEKHQAVVMSIDHVGGFSDRVSPDANTQPLRAACQSPDSEPCSS